MLSTVRSAPSAYARFAVMIAAGSALLAVSAQVAVPLWPVPVTLQTLAVPVLVALLGGRLATLSVVAYLVEAAAGLPVLAHFTGGPVALLGPTGGYALGFLPQAAIVGLLYERGALRYRERLAAVVAGDAAVFACGALWLSAFVGPERAVALGVVPFLIGDAAKCVVAAGLRPLRRIG